MSAETDRWDDWLGAIHNDGVNLTPREEEFVASIQAQRDAGRTLTEKQAEWLEQIYSTRTP